MAFRFRLEKAMKYRQRLVDQQGQVVAAAERNVADISRRIRNLSHEIVAFESSFPTGETAVSIQERMNMTTWIQQCRTRRSGMGVELFEAEQVRDSEREKMTRTWQDLEVIKRLRIRQKTLWLADDLKRENRDLDEVGIQRADRNRREKLASV